MAGAPEWAGAPADPRYVQHRTEWLFLAAASDAGRPHADVRRTGVRLRPPVPASLACGECTAVPRDASIQCQLGTRRSDTQPGWTVGTGTNREPSREHR